MKKCFSSMALLLGLGISAICSSGAAQKQPSVLPPHWGNLDGIWFFRTDPDDVGEKQGWAAPNLREDGWRTLVAPGHWEVQGVTDPRPGKPPKSKEGMPWTDYDGVAWYRLRFVVPKEWAGQEMLLRLGSVDDYDRAYLNGRLIGETPVGVKRAVSVHRLYQVPSDAVRFGKENVLAIRVVDGGGPGGLVGPLLTFLPRKIMETPMKLPQSDRSLRDRFVEPAAPSRILKIIHSWPDQPEAQDTLINSLIAQGFGGVVCNVSFTDYLVSEEKWGAFVRAVSRAKEAGMSLWLYDEHGYPSGVAGGLTLRDHPEWEARGLLIAEADANAGGIELDIPPGRLVKAAAYPREGASIDVSKATDLESRVQAGKLRWDAPPGRWRVMVVTESRLYEGTHAAVSLADKLPYINLLMPEPTARFIELTHEAYARHLGDDLGKWFVATFTDEPSLMSMFMRPMPYRVLPWSPNLMEEFRRRRGYDLAPVLPALVADVGGAEKKARYDFWRTVAELVSENFFGQIQAWCRRRNILSGGHLLAEESLTAHVALYGDFFRCVRRLDAPSIDCLTSLPPNVPWFIARLVSSAADLEGRTVTMCETSDFVQRYRPQGDKRPVQQVSEDEIRGTCNRLMLGGINTITSYYSFAGLSSEQLRRLNLWVGRCCTMLAGGHQVTDIAVLYPIESLWPRFRPARRGATDSPSAIAVQEAFNRATSSLYEARRDFTYVDSRTLAEAKVEEGALVHGALRWRVIVLPCADTLPMRAWDNLERFWRGGGAVVCLAALPKNSEKEFPSPAVEALASEMFGRGDGLRLFVNPAGGVAAFLPEGSEVLLPLVLEGIIEADVKVRDPRSPLRATHRRIAGHEVYFIVNDSGDPCEDFVTAAAEGQGEAWDPNTGEVKPIRGCEDVKVSLGPYGGIILRFPAARAPRRLRVESGGLPGLKLAAIPLVQPSVSKGQFVHAELGPDVALNSADAPVWQAKGTLTKAQVDTFLFLCFEYAKPIDLSHAHCVVLDTWVPEGQSTSNSLLVVLREKDGSDYIASVGRSLGAPGHMQCFVPLRRFKLAGWSKDADGRLDLSAVSAIRVGWGGYYGAQGEVVRFSLALPQIATVRK